MSFAQLDLYRSCATVVDTDLGKEGGEDPATVIVDVLSSATGVDPEELPRLYEAIDPDIIEHLIHASKGEHGPAAILGFEYGRWNVYVNSEGRIRICDTAKDVDPTPIFLSKSKTDI